MKSLTVSCWKIPEGWSKCFWKMKSKKVFSKYVIQNDPEKHHTLNTLSNINSLALFYDWDFYSMDWFLWEYSGQSRVSFPKALPQLSPTSRPSSSVLTFTPLIAFFLRHEVIETMKKHHELSVRVCYCWQKSSTWTPRENEKEQET